MIQQIREIRSKWTLHVIEFDHAQKFPGIGFVFPTTYMVYDEKFRFKGDSEPMAEIDQDIAEEFLEKLFDSEGEPDELLVQDYEEWDKARWESFGKEFGVKIRFCPKVEGPAVPPAVLSIVKELFDFPDPRPEDADALFDTAAKLRSLRVRERYCKLILGINPDFAPAKLELADIAFGRGEWKQCRKMYAEVFRREEEKWRGRYPSWWIDVETRLYLRAGFGMAMCDWHLGRLERTAETFAALLEKNPNDNQGIRFYLPLVLLLADDIEGAAKFYEKYEKNYKDDFIDPSFYFGWALTLHLCGNESAAREKYQAAMLRNIYMAPMLLEEEMPPEQLWFPNDRSEPAYAEEFMDSYSALWEKETSSLRLVREVWHECAPKVRAIVEHRKKILDFQDQRFEPDYRRKWEELMKEDARLTGERAE